MLFCLLFCNFEIAHGAWCLHIALWCSENPGLYSLQHLVDFWPQECCQSFPGKKKKTEKVIFIDWILNGITYIEMRGWTGLFTMRSSVTLSLSFSSLGWITASSGFSEGLGSAVVLLVHSSLGDSGSLSLCFVQEKGFVDVVTSNRLHLGYTLLQKLYGRRPNLPTPPSGDH